MIVREEKSFCRTCTGFCGVTVSIDENGRVAQIRGDKSHPLTQGFACIKGLVAPEAHNGPQRLLHTMKRQADGDFRPIPAEDALDEVAAKLEQLIAEDGVQTVSGYLGTMAAYDHLTMFALVDFIRAVGSNQMYTSFTIDQSCRYITTHRMGSWAAGCHQFEDSDVYLLIGANPVVSVAQPGFTSNPVKTIKRAKARGLKLIVIDPRRSETAAMADVFLQIYPGEDPTVLAGILRIILHEGWHDRDFCARYVDGLEKLRAAVEPFTPDYVAARAGIEPPLLREAAETFAKGSRGAARTSTGATMSPRSNLMEHLAEAINVVCGRYVRAGDPVPNPGVLSPRYPRYAHVIAGGRPWERGPRSRVHDYGQLAGGFPTSQFTEQVLTPGEGRIRALLVGGGNPTSAIPDQRRVVGAMRALDLLVTCDPVMSTTARLAHYVFAPKLQYERPSPTPLFYHDGWSNIRPLAGWTPAIVEPPPGSEVIDEWSVYWGLAKRLGLQLTMSGAPVDMQTMPTSEDMQAIVLRNSPVPFEEIKRRAGQIVDVEPQFVEPGDPSNTAKFDLWPAELDAVLKEVAGEPVKPGIVVRDGVEYRFRLISRRMREVTNSMYKELDTIRERVQYNPAFMHPDDLQDLGLKTGDQVLVESDNGRIAAIVESEPVLRRGVVSMAHAWGGLPDEKEDYGKVGSNVNVLISTRRDFEPINAMPRMSAIPVNITPSPNDLISGCRSDASPGENDPKLA